MLTDAQIEEIVVADTALVSMAFQYGWTETETQSQLFDLVYSSIVEEDFEEDDVCFDKIKTIAKKLGLTIL